jgi:hypothetical protein
MRSQKFVPQLPTNTKPFRFCNECPALTEDVRRRLVCLTHGRLKSKTKFVAAEYEGQRIEEPVRHTDCKDKPKNAEAAVANQILLKQPNSSPSAQGSE